MSKKVFIDGHAGTVGLRVRDWLSGHGDLEIVTLAEERRKDPDARREMILSSEVAILCLPNEAALEVADWADGGTTRLIDASTARRVADDWVYGLPELTPSQRDLIRDAKCVSNPGCYSSAFILLTRPLVDAGLLPKNAPVVVHAVSGYSGGGRSMIERWEGTEHALGSRRYEVPYALQSVHKHIPEMTKYSGLVNEPQFIPSVGQFRCGMRVHVPIHAALLNDDASGERIWEALKERYRAETFIEVLPLADAAPFEDATFDPGACNDTNRIELRVFPHPSGHVMLMATLDNLGKGACGMAIQSLNLMLGFPEHLGLP